MDATAPSPTIPRVQAPARPAGAACRPARDILGLERISALLDRLGNPERALPPVFHVAGTNGKGSTCAFLRAAIEAAGLTRPRLYQPASRPLQRAHPPRRPADRRRGARRACSPRRSTPPTDMEISFFEATTAAAFLAFARTPADACIVEVGLGGRLDATNVIAAPAGLRHRPARPRPSRLPRRPDRGDRRRESRASPSPACRCVTQHYPEPHRRADRRGAPRRPARSGCRAAAAGTPTSTGGSSIIATTRGELELPLPRLAGAHQAMNAALAVAMLRHQEAARRCRDPALRAAMGWAEWPARLQRLGAGPARATCCRRAPSSGSTAPTIRPRRAPSPISSAAMCRPAGRSTSSSACSPTRTRPACCSRFRGRAAHPPRRAGPRPRASCARGARRGRARGGAERDDRPPDVEDALGWIARHADRARPPVVLIMGSLYLAGEVLEGERPAAGLKPHCSRLAQAPPSGLAPPSAYMSASLLARSQPVIRFARRSTSSSQRRHASRARGRAARSARPPGGIAPRRRACARRDRRRARAPARSRPAPRAAGRAAGRRGHSRSATRIPAAPRAAAGPRSNRPASKQARASLSRAARSLPGRLGHRLAIMARSPRPNAPLSASASPSAMRLAAVSAVSSASRARAKLALRIERLDRRRLDRPHLAAAGTGRAASRRRHRRGSRHRQEDDHHQPQAVAAVADADAPRRRSGRGPMTTTKQHRLRLPRAAACRRRAVALAVLALRLADRRRSTSRAHPPDQSRIARATPTDRGQPVEVRQSRAAPTSDARRSCRQQAPDDARGGRDQGILRGGEARSVSAEK